MMYAYTVENAARYPASEKIATFERESESLGEKRFRSNRQALLDYIVKDPCCSE